MLTRPDKETLNWLQLIWESKQDTPAHNDTIKGDSTLGQETQKSMKCDNHKVFSPTEHQSNNIQHSCIYAYRFRHGTFSVISGKSFNNYKITQ